MAELRRVRLDLRARDLSVSGADALAVDDVVALEVVAFVAKTEPLRTKDGTPYVRVVLDPLEIVLEQPVSELPEVASL